MLLKNDIKSIEHKVQNIIKEINLLGGKDRLSILYDWLKTQPCIIAIKREPILTSFPGSTGVTIRTKTNNGSLDLRLSLKVGKREEIGKKKFHEDYDYIELDNLSAIIDNN